MPTPLLELELPFPAARLNPNRANGRKWQARNGTKRDARDAAYLATLEASHTRALVTDRAPYITQLEIEFCPPDARRRDLDNLLAAMKPSIDGIAAALAVDDAVFRTVTLRRGQVCKGGKCIIKIA